MAPGKIGGHRKPVLDPHRAFIVELIRQTPHLTLDGPKEELAARDVKVSHHALWTFLRREGLSFEKTLFASSKFACAWPQTDLLEEPPRSSLVSLACLWWPISLNRRVHDANKMREVGLADLPRNKLCNTITSRMNLTLTLRQRLAR